MVDSYLIKAGVVTTGDTKMMESYTLNGPNRDCTLLIIDVMIIRYLSQKGQSICGSELKAQSVVNPGISALFI